MKSSYILSFHCPDKSGIQSKVSSLLFNNDAFLTDVQSYSDVESKSFFSRIVFLVDSEGVISKISSDLKLLGQELNMEWSIDIEGRKVKTIIIMKKKSNNRKKQIKYYSMVQVKCIIFQQKKMMMVLIF